ATRSWTLVPRGWGVSVQDLVRSAQAAPGSAQVGDDHRFGFAGDLRRAGYGAGQRPARVAGGRAAAATLVDHQAVDRIRYRVQRRGHGRQPAEGVPRVGVAEGDLEDHAPRVPLPVPVAAAVGDRRLDERSPVGGAPLLGGERAVQYLDGPPVLRHGAPTVARATFGRPERHAGLPDPPDGTSPGTPRQKVRYRPVPPRRRRG